LTGLLAEDEIELAGAAVGALPEGSAPILGEHLAPGDEIVLVASSGLHANGASLARALAARLPDGYGTALPGGETFGEALLEPSLMYVALIARLMQRGAPPTYISHVTGHGLLKLMRARAELTYRIKALPPVPEVLRFLAGEARMDDREAYSTLNMGTGLALFCAPGGGAQAVALAGELGMRALLAGEVEEGPRQVLLEPLGLRFTAGELALSPDAA
jgi:phosphoribosylformylglycinamidine cyclo-ligase